MFPLPPPASPRPATLFLLLFFSAYAHQFALAALSFGGAR